MALLFYSFSFGPPPKRAFAFIPFRLDIRPSVRSRASRKADALLALPRRGSAWMLAR